MTIPGTVLNILIKRATIDVAPIVDVLMESTNLGEDELLELVAQHPEYSPAWVIDTLLEHAGINRLDFTTEFLERRLKSLSQLITTFKAHPEQQLFHYLLRRTSLDWCDVLEFVRNQNPDFGKDALTHALIRASGDDAVEITRLLVRRALAQGTIHQRQVSSMVVRSLNFTWDELVADICATLGLERMRLEEEIRYLAGTPPGKFAEGASGKNIETRGKLLTALLTRFDVPYTNIERTFGLIVESTLVH